MWSTTPTLVLIPILIYQAYFSSAYAADFLQTNVISPPNLNSSALGSLEVYGDFDGLSLYQYQGQETVLNQPVSDDSIIIQKSNQVFAASPLTNGRVLAACIMNDNRTAIVAGNFTSIASTAAPAGIARLDLVQGNASSLGSLSSVSPGDIKALYCNGSTVYVGGNLNFGGSHGAIVWDANHDQWRQAPFGGFLNGSVVNTIAAGPASDSLIFGGEILGLAETSISSTNITNSSSALPGTQLVSFGLAKAQGFANSSSQAQNVSSIFCPSNNAGFVTSQDSTTGSISINIGYEVVPKKIRLYNLAGSSGDGTKVWRLITQPSGGIMNLTYTDPSSGETRSCSEYCPLVASTSSPYQEFEFVNYVPTTELSIMMLDFYGTNAGLSAVELYEDGQYIYADTAYMTPGCQSTPQGASVNGNIGSSSLRGSGWTASSQGYMQTNITDSAAIPSTSATFLPVGPEGLYTVNLYTPGCAMDNSCSQRGGVNVTVIPGGVYESVSSVIYQTNEEVKYDTIYNGTLTANSTVTVTPLDTDRLPLNFVAWKLGLTYLGGSTHLNATALFEYSPQNFSKWLANSSYNPISGRVNALGITLGPNSIVSAITSSGNGTLLIGGSHFANVSSNLLQVDDSSVTPVNFTGGITDLVAVGRETFAVSDKSNAFSVNQNSVQMIGNSTVSSITPFLMNGSVVAALSSTNFDDTVSFWTQGKAIDPKDYNQTFSGHISRTILVGSIAYYFGSLEIQQVAADGGTSLFGTSLKSQPFAFKKDSTSSNKEMLQHRDLPSSESSAYAIYSGLYLNDTVVMLGGNFTATVSNGQTVSNLLLVKGNESSEVDAFNNATSGKGAIYTIISSNSTVAICGALTGNSINGIVLYDPKKNMVSETQLPVLAGSATVQTAVFMPNDTTRLIVGGQFDDKECPGVCSYDVQKSSRSQLPGLSFSSSASISQLTIDKPDRLLIGGSLSNISSESSFIGYNLTSGDRQDFSNGLKGPVTSFVVADSSRNSFVVSGTVNETRTPYLGIYSDGEWHAIDTPFNSSSSIKSISLVPLDDDSSNNNNSTLGPHRGIVASGSMLFNDSTVAGLALWDGVRWTPYILTTGSSAPGFINGLYSQKLGRLDGGIKTGSTSSASPKPHNPSSPGMENSRHYMETGHVVGVSCAIAIGCVLAIVGLYLLGSWISGARRRSQEGPMRVEYQNLQKAVPPETLMEEKTQWESM